MGISMGDKEDIVSRLEALRRKVPEEKEKPAAAPPPEDKKRKKARVVGLVVIAIIAIGLVSILSYTFIIKPQQEQAAAERDRQEALQKQQEELLRQKELLAKELAFAKSEKISYLEDSFSELPEEYYVQRDRLIQKVNMSTTKEEVEKIDEVEGASAAWRAYWGVEADEKAKTADRLQIKLKREVMKEELDKTTNETILVPEYVPETYSGDPDYIKDVISELYYPDLATIKMSLPDTVVVPLKLTRLQAAIGLLKPGDIVDVYYKNATGTNEVTGETTYEVEFITTGARVIAILGAKATGTIALSESESKTDAGGGVEGKGTATSLGIGASASLTGAYEGSAGYKSRTKSSAYTVDIAEIQKAAAANKISEDYLTEMLMDYGIKLADFERETNLADFDTEYLVLLEVPRDKAQETLKFSILLADTETGYYNNLILTIPTKQQPDWMREIS